MAFGLNTQIVPLGGAFLGLIPVPQISLTPSDSGLGFGILFLLMPPAPWLCPPAGTGLAPALLPRGKTFAERGKLIVPISIVRQGVS